MVISVSFKLFPNISRFSLFHEPEQACTHFSKEKVKLTFWALHLDKYDIPNFQETLKINMNLMIINETIDSDMHEKNKRQDTFNFFHQACGFSYQGFDTLILAIRFWHLVAKKKS